MNVPINTTYRKGAAAIKLALSINLLVSMVLPMVTLPAYSQADFDQSSLLPPEVVPIQQSSFVNATNQAQANPISQVAPPTANIPGLVAKPNMQAAGMSAQDMRKELFNQLMGQNNAPQLNNQNNVWTNQGQGAQPMPQFNQAPAQYNQAPNQYNPVPGQFGQPLGQSSQPLVQANQSVGQSSWMTPQQNNAMANALPAQTQTLSGNVQNACATQNGSAFSHTLGTLGGFGMAAYALGLGRGSGGFYSGALMGGSMLNYGLRNGFRF